MNKHTYEKTGAKADITPCKQLLLFARVFPDPSFFEFGPF